MRSDSEQNNSRSVPDRSLDQRMRALEKANEIRFFRANLKRDLKAYRVGILDILSDPPEQLDSMKVFELLLSVPTLGRAKVTKMMNACHMSPSKTISGMTHRQKSELLSLLRRRF